VLAKILGILKIELLDTSCNMCLHVTLRDVIMSICCPNQCQICTFLLCQQIILQTISCPHCVLTLAESFVHAMILALLPFLQWKYLKPDGKYAEQAIAKWFKPSAWLWAVDAYWVPHNKCVKNMRDKMLDVMNLDTNDLYWAINQVPPYLNVSIHIPVKNQSMTQFWW